VFVGCARYTQSYSGLFGNAEYWTIDPAARSARWGATLHVVDRLQCLGRHFAPDSLDLVVCNGVLGWGLDRRADAEAAFDACRRALRPGGWLVLGWNDVWPRNRVQPRSLVSLARFHNAEVPGLGTEAVRLDVPHRHVFECYRKPGADAGQGASVVVASGAGAQPPSARQRPSMHSS
jgi:SAM-dependent methyltransferase